MDIYTRIDGVASSQAIDTSGEIVDLKGLDISSLIGGPFTWEHNNQTPATVVGKILDARKIFSLSDCENDRHRYFWNKCRIPFLYVMGRLFDDKKPSAKEVAALFKDDAEHPEEQDIIGFSIEGSKISKTGSVVDRSIARRVTCTVVPCNKQCIAEVLPIVDKVKSDDLSTLFKCEMQLFSFEPSYVELLEKKDAHGEPLSKPYSSEAQRRWAHTAAGKKALGGEAGVHEWDEATKGKKLPEKVGKKEDMKKDVGTGGGAFIGSQLAMSEMKKDEAHGWSKPRTKPRGLDAGVYLLHPKLGTLSISKHPETGDYHVKHNKAHKGSFKTSKDTAKFVHDYMNATGRGKVDMPKSEDMNKALTAGSMMAAPGSLVGGAALGKESLERRSQNVNSLRKKEKSHWFNRADEAYQSWPDRENFREYMKKRMPHLADGEVDSIGRILALKKNRQREGQLSKMFASHYIKSEKEMDKGTDVMMASEEMEKYLMQSEDKKKA